jgi:3-hydroxybutyryl-CoA dehydrogenase
LQDLKDSDLVIEAIIENKDIKTKVFTELETYVSENCIIGSNTSSISITSLGAELKKPERFIGIHFFNPAPLMPLVEVIPSLLTEKL